MINLPCINWFYQRTDSGYIGNTYSGSVRIDVNDGDLSQITFNYSVYVSASADETFTLTADSWWRTSWEEGAEVYDYKFKEFKATREGIRKAESWLTKRFKSSNFK